MHRQANLIRIALIVLGLVPIGAWIAIASTLEPAGLGRSIGQAILVVLSPLPLGGVLMILGSALFQAKPRGGRIVATVGAAIVAVGALFLTTVWVRRFTGCGGPAGICTPELMQALGLLVYAMLHGALIAWVWRSRRNSEPAERFPPPGAAAAK